MHGYLINHYKYNVNTQSENYFFSLLLIFKLWRKIEELKHGCDIYAESFHKVELHHYKITFLKKGKKKGVKYKRAP